MRFQTLPIITGTLIFFCIGCPPDRGSIHPGAAAPDELDAICQQAIAALIQKDSDTLQRLGLSASRAKFAFTFYDTLGLQPTTTTGEFIADAPSAGGHGRLYRILARNGKSFRVRCIFHDGQTTLAGLNVIEDPTSPTRLRNSS